jgi:outer membrane lipoprotein-sorting protein
MKNFVRLTFTAIIFAFIFNLSANAQATIVPEILKRMDNYNKALTSLKSDVTMSKINTQLNVEDIYQGTVAYRPNGKDIAIRIDWSKPRAETLAVLNGQYVAYTPSLNQAIVGKANGKGKSSASGALAFLNMSKSQLKANYSVVNGGEETIGDGTKCWHLIMTPKVKTSYKQAELWVDINGMPRQSKIFENNDDVTTVLLTNIKENVDIPGSFFAVDLPKNVKKIKG